MSAPLDDRLFWDPASGKFDGVALRGAIVARGWTVKEFAGVAGVSHACLYNALASRGVSDRTAICVFRTLTQRDRLVIGEVGTPASQVMANVPSRHHI